MNIILFDGLCNLCNRTVLFIIRRDKQELFKFASLQSDIGQEMLKRLNIDSKKSDSIVYLKGANYFIKSSAILNILRDMKGGWQIFYLLIFLPRFIRDFVYDIIAKSRYRLFGKRESCMVPSDNIKDRFLE